MKKKQSIREQREAQKAAQKQKFSAAQAMKKETAPQQSVSTAALETAKENDKPIKSRNKAAGLKSTLVSGKSVYLTSFGKGNAAIVEHEVRTDKDFASIPLTDNVTLKVSVANDEAFSFSGTRVFTDPDVLRADNPLHTPALKPTPKTGQDLLGLKDDLEMRYYGRTFDDNVHIQIIYNILDIEKILAVHITNVAAVLDHMFSDLLGEKEDFIGYMNTMNIYEVFMHPSKDAALDNKAVENINASRSRFERLLNTKRLGYFGFEYNPKAKNAEEQKKRIYHLMGIIGHLRQWTVHDLNQTWLYQLNNHLHAEYLQTLDYYFGSRFQEINEDFLNQNKVNLLILKDCFNQVDETGLAQLYYDFIVFKSQKNLGFSIKKLREIILDREETAEFKNQKMDSVRSKLYKLIDFCLFHYYKSHDTETETLVRNLRSSMSDSEKEQFYIQAADALWDRHKSVFRHFQKKLRGENIKTYQKMELSDTMNKSHLLHLLDSNISYFSKLMYALCLFLDGKEINDLLTTLLNKLDNIASLNTCAEELGIKAPFVPEYVFFEDSMQYVTEINIVKNIARMTKPSPNVKKPMFRDALNVLGIPSNMSEETLDQEIDKFLENGGKHDFRNFISKNVIKSSQFIYVIKFCNPKTVKQIVQNQEVVQFVLKQIPEAQIKRYYFSCIKDAFDTCSCKKKIQQLSDMMTRIDYGTFENVSQRSKNREKQLEKERFKAIVRLYLIVIYLVVKNLVNINARYVIAFHCLERDATIYGEPFRTAIKSKDFLALTDQFCQDGDTSRSGYLARNRRIRACVAQDVANAKSYLISASRDNVSNYRNCVAHLNVIRNCDKWIGDISRVSSYYALYQYLVQRFIAEGVDPNHADLAQQSPYYAALCRYHSYVKDFVKALNAPFGYNIPRFKNLTVEQLFDRNYQLETASHCMR